MIDAGLFKIAVPKRYGGYETSIRTMLEVSAAVGEADGGTAWVLTLVNVCNWLVGLFPQQAQDDVFGADPGALVSGVLAPTATAVKVDGGWRVTGKWFYNSGSWHATWAGLGFPVTDDGGEVVNQGLALIPRADLGLEDTWFVAGMKSSGSNCLVAEDVFVPEHRVMLVPPAIVGEYGTEHAGSEPLYRSAFVPVLALVLVGPQLGLGQAALDYVISKAGEEAGLLHVLHRPGRVGRLPAADRRGGAAARHRAAARLAGGRRHRRGGRPRRVPRLPHPGPGPVRHRVRRRVRHPGDRHPALRARRGLVRRRQPAAADLARLGHRRPPRGRLPAGQL